MIKHFLTSLFLYTAIILAVLVLLALARFLDPRGTMQVGDTKACKELGLANC